MNIFIVYWHPEPASFNAAMLRTAEKVLTAQGHEVRVSDLDAMAFDPVSGRHNLQPAVIRNITASALKRPMLQNIRVSAACSKMRFANWNGVIC